MHKSGWFIRLNYTLRFIVIKITGGQTFSVFAFKGFFNLCKMEYVILVNIYYMVIKWPTKSTMKFFYSCEGHLGQNAWSIFVLHICTDMPWHFELFQSKGKRYNYSYGKRSTRKYSKEGKNCFSVHQKTEHLKWNKRYLLHSTSKHYYANRYIFRILYKLYLAVGRVA